MTDVKDEMLNAAHTGDLEHLKSLHEANLGIKLDGVTNQFGYTLLHFAAINGHNQIVEFLIQQDFNVNALDNFNNTALDHADLHEHVETTRMLIDQGGEFGRTRAAHDIDYNNRVTNYWTEGADNAVTTTGDPDEYDLYGSLCGEYYHITQTI